MRYLSHRCGRQTAALCCAASCLLAGRLAHAAPPAPDSRGPDADAATLTRDPAPSDTREISLPPVDDDHGTPQAPAPTAPAAVTADEVSELQRRIEVLERALAQRDPHPPAPTEPAKVPQSNRSSDAHRGDSPDNRQPDYATGFHFGSYGRVVAGTDHRGRPGRDADIVSHGSRLDEDTYAELELRREDYWAKTNSHTRIVATVAFAAPLFHYNASFEARLAIRNLYLEESGLGLKRLKVWAGARMYRGDDIYLLNFWPLDNLNTLGGGLSYEFIPNLVLRLHSGVNQPRSPFFIQDGTRPLPLQQLGGTQVRITDRQKSVSSFKLSHIFAIGKTGGIKPVIYAEVHYTPKAQRELDPQRYESLPADRGFVAGTQIGLFTGRRSTHVNLVFRYAGGLAAYGEFNPATGLNSSRTSTGAREIVTALGANYEVGWFGLLAGAYWRHFRNANGNPDFDDLSEGIVAVRPTFWFGELAGLSLEGSYQAQQRGVLIPRDGDNKAPQFAQVGRIGVVPFLSPGGRGNYVRPHLRLIYAMTIRDAGAQRLYPREDVFGLRRIDHFFALGAEWWFGSTSYFRD